MMICFRSEKNVLITLALALCQTALIYCKTIRIKNEPVQTTNAPVRKPPAPPKLKAGKADISTVKSDQVVKTPSGQVLSSKDVGTAEVPLLTLNIDLTQCIGVGKWLDPKAAGGQSPASISVVPRLEVSGAKQQPQPWLVELTDSTSAIHSNSWRMAPGSYSIELVSFDIESAGEESKLTKKFDFTTTHELVMNVVGAWLPTKTCDLHWKTAP